MIERILPTGLAVAEARSTDDDAFETWLFPEERAIVADAVPGRRAEFALGRHCARQALGQLGAPGRPIPSGASREPLWPDGFVGSITHCGGYCAAAVGRSAKFRTLGIDAEPDEPLPPEVLAEIALPHEAAEVTAAPGGNLDRLLFCAKEAVYKAWFPLARRWLGFEEASIALASDGTFRVRVLVPGPVTELDGRWIRHDGLILTAIALGSGARKGRALSR